jgi:hypothetical protein
MDSNSIAVLGGGPGLGFYIPGLILKYQLETYGYHATFYTYESYLDIQVQDKLKSTMFKFHSNFKAALFSQKLAKPIIDSIDEPSCAELFRNWEQQGTRNFLVFSGHWIPILKRYGQKNTGITVYLCHIDVVDSTSWSLYETPEPFFRHTWFWDWQHKKTNYYLDISGEEIIPFSQREERYITHGGGWGMGTYLEKINTINNRSVYLDVIFYDDNDFKNGLNRNNNYYLIDTGWKYWKKDASGNHLFPPFGKYVEGEETIYHHHKPYPEVYDVIKNKWGIISKPGAGTLLDSFSAATPLIVLEPFGDYEDKNGRLWIELGFGVSFDDWQHSDCPAELMKTLHDNIVSARKTTANFTQELCNRKQLFNLT